MSQIYTFEEVDDATRQYLAEVRQRQGEGCPGVYVARSNWLPWVGFFAGLVVIGVTLWFTVPPLRDPAKEAMLQTAGLLLGGWLVLATIRVWAGGRHSFGYFVFADARRLWEATGTTLKVTSLKSCQGAEGVDNFNEGAYQNTAITIFLDKGRYVINVANQTKAADMVAFLNNLAALRSDPKVDWVKEGAGALGHAALQMDPGSALAGYPPPLPEAVDVDVPAEFRDSPKPVREGRARSGIVAYAVIILAALAGVFLLRPLNAMWRDDAVFAMVKDQDPDSLRAYLVDQRNTRHRADIEKRLASFYEPGIQALRKHIQDKTADPVLAGEYLELLSLLTNTLQPIVSLEVKEEGNVPGNQIFFLTAQQREQKVREWLANSLVNSQFQVRNGRPISGHHLIAFIQVPDQAKPILAVRYRVAEAGPGSYKFTWTVSVRRRATDEKAVSKSWESTRNNVGNLLQALEVETKQALRHLSGQDNLTPPLPLWAP